MKATSGQKVKIGLFTAMGLLVLVLAIFFIGNQKNMFSSTFNVYGIFKNVSGLQVGNNVRFAGINVGVIQAINIVNDSSVRVDITLNNKVKPFVRKDCKLNIGSDGLMGDKLIVIAPGGITTTQTVQNGDQLATIPPLDIDKLIGKVTGVVTNAESLTAGLSEIIAKINSGKGSIGRLLNNDKMAKDLEGTVKSAKSTIDNVHATTATLNTDLKAAQSNFLLKGFFKKKKKKELQDSIKKAEAAAAAQAPPVKQKQ
jgi:phospholipid/cholesterol/gamma-HCH transport system substrate-binding protein